jgi:hypothetical protein
MSERPGRRREPKAGETYRHFKGRYYVIVGTGVHTETEEKLVVYRARKTGALFARPLRLFLMPTCRDGREVARFVLVSR